MIYIIVMGRKKLNRTKEEIKEQWRKRRMKYYEKNKDVVKKRELKRYYENKKRNIQNIK